MALLLRDFVTTTLATAPSGTTGTTLTVQAGDGALFPAVSVGDVIPAVIEAVDGSAREAVVVTARTGDSFTVTRSSAPVAWSGSGQVFYLALTAAAIDELKKASGHSVVPAGGIAATDVQAALEELDADIAAVAAARAATQAEVDALETVVGTKAPINNPVFTGTVTLAGNAAGPLQAVPLQQLVAYIENQCFDVGDYKLTSRASFGAGRRWLLCDNKTIGSATSGATALASAEAQALFEHLWATYDNTLCPIQDSTGAASTRGASATADFTANKRLPLLDWRGLSIRMHHHGSSTYETDVTRALGSYQADALKSHYHYTNIAAFGSNSSNVTRGDSAETASGGFKTSGPRSWTDDSFIGGAETRGRNRSLNMFIRY